MQMNTVCMATSHSVQPRRTKVVSKNTNPGRPAPANIVITIEEEIAMFKTISAALVVASLVAAPAMAATTQTKGDSVAKSVKVASTPVKTSNLNKGRHVHHRHYVRNHHARQHIAVAKKPVTAGVMMKQPGSKQISKQISQSKQVAPKTKS